MTQLTKRVLFTSRTYLHDAAVDNLDILRSSLANNSRAGISSTLVKAGDRFFQLIEGPPHEVELCLCRIEGDHRHFDFQVLLEGFGACSLLDRCPMNFVQEPAAEIGGEEDAACTAHRLLRLPCTVN